MLARSLRTPGRCRAAPPGRTAPRIMAVATAKEALALKKHFWEWRGHKTAYVTAGCGRPVVLVHGFGASAGHWRALIPYLVASGHKIYAPDLLGFGASEKPLLEEGYTMELWDQQLRDFMAEFVQEPAVVVGNSVGSLASLMVAAAAPESVRGVALLNCAGGMNNKAIADDWRIKLAMPIFLLIDWILKQPALARRLFDNVRATDNLKQILESVYPSNPAAVDDDLVALLHEPSNDPGALETFVSVITGPPGPRPEELVPRVKSPLLLVWGDADNFTPSDGPVGRYFQGLAESREATRFVHLPGCGHCPFDENPEGTWAALEPFFKEL